MQTCTGGSRGQYRPRYEAMGSLGVHMHHFHDHTPLYKLRIGYDINEIDHIQAFLSPYQNSRPRDPGVFRM